MTATIPLAAHPRSFIGQFGLAAGFQTVVTGAVAGITWKLGEAAGHTPAQIIETIRLTGIFSIFAGGMGAYAMSQVQSCLSEESPKEVDGRYVATLLGTMAGLVISGVAFAKAQTACLQENYSATPASNTDVYVGAAAENVTVLTPSSPPAKITLQRRNTAPLARAG